MDINKIPTNNDKPQIDGINILKLLCAYLVLNIHVGSPLRPYIMPFCRIAVPIFFIISGYFLPNSSCQLDTTRIKNATIKALRLFIWGQIIFIIFHLTQCIKNPETFNDIFLSVRKYIYLFLFGHSLGNVLWYLMSYFQSLLIIWIFSKLNLQRMLWLFIPIGLAINLILGKYSFLIGDKIYALEIHRNALTIGLPCVITGILLRKNKHLIPSLYKLTFLVFSFVILMICEMIMLGLFGPQLTVGDISLMTVPLAIVVFAWFLKVPVSSKLKWCVNLGRYHSLNIYIFHTMVATFLFDVLANFSIFPSLIAPVIVFILTIGFSYLMIYLKNSSFMPNSLKYIVQP